MRISLETLRLTARTLAAADIAMATATVAGLAGLAEEELHDQIGMLCMVVAWLAHCTAAMLPVVGFAAVATVES